VKERKLREKEAAYLERLKKCESRERKKRADYQEEKKNEMARKKAINKEAKKLRQFLEDYDDDKDDQVYFKGGAHLEKKLKVREKEIETDNRERQRERDELDQLKKRLRASWSMSKWKLNELV
jgi:RNA-binding protein 25